MIVTTEMTAVTPTMMPTRGSPVRSLFWRRLAGATRKAFQRAANRRAGNERIRPGRKRRRSKPVASGFASLRGDIAAPPIDPSRLFRSVLADRNDPARARRDVVLVRD